MFHHILLRFSLSPSLLDCKVSKLLAFSFAVLKLSSAQLTHFWNAAQSSTKNSTYRYTCFLAHLPQSMYCHFMIQYASWDPVFIGLPVTNDGQNMSNQSSMATVFKNLTHCDSICSINYLRDYLIKTNYINTYHQSSDASFALSTSQRATKSLSSERTSSRAA